MLRHLKHAVAFLPFLLMMTLTSASVLAQEIDRSIDRPESEKTREEREQDQAIKDFFSGKRLLMPADATMRHTERMMLELNKDAPPTTYVNFGEPDAFSSNHRFWGFSARRIEFRSNYWNASLVVHDLSANQTKECFNEKDLFVLSGYVTPADEQWFKTNKAKYVIASAFSPKEFKREQAQAAALLLKRFGSDEIVAFDGLPYEKVAARSRAELRRMGLPVSIKAWRDARKDIHDALGNIATKTANKDGLEQELRSGSKNVLFLMAHSDSESIYLPGLRGGRLSMKELNQIRRDAAPNRVVVLLACKTGQVNGKTNSIAEIILKNKLATTVLATDGYVDAAELGSMLREFQSHGDLSRAFPDLRAIVELKSPAISKFHGIMEQRDVDEVTVHKYQSSVWNSSFGAD
jgi:hypothetical protein